MKAGFSGLLAPLLLRKLNRYPYLLNGTSRPGHARPCPARLEPRRVLLPRINPASCLVAALIMGLNFQGAAWAADDRDADRVAPTIGVMQVTPKQKRQEDKPLDIKIQAPTLNFDRSGVSSVTRFPTRKAKTKPKAPSVSSRPAVKPPPAPEPERRTPPLGAGAAPIPIRVVPPQYPPAANKRETGSVVVSFIVTSGGSTSDIRVMESTLPSEFDKAAVAAVNQWRFKPYRAHGKPANVRVKQRINFSPQSTPDSEPEPQSEPATKTKTRTASSKKRAAPVPARIVPPQYPQSAVHTRPSGYVVIAFTVTSSGRTRNIDVVKSTPTGVFDEAAVKAVRQWRFEPYRADGKPASVRVRQRINFSP